MWLFEDIFSANFFVDGTIFLGCISFEDRCKTAAQRISAILTETIPIKFFEIEDDECTYPVWKEECKSKIKKNWVELKIILSKKGITLNDWPDTYKMSSRPEEILKLKFDIRAFKKENSPAGGKIKCVFDLSCIPSYFAYQLLKDLVEDDSIDDLIVLYTKPRKYPPKNEVLKTSPFDKTKPDFLPSFNISNIRKGKVKWIVGLGFDYDSIKNAQRIKESNLNIDKTHLIIPFPPYKPEYLYRALNENKDLLDRNQDFLYVPADNPFRAFHVITGIAKNSEEFILSSFGPKPIGLGFCMAAIKLNIPILHVQATNYNPNYSTGEGSTLVYWVKYGGKPWWDYFENNDDECKIN